MNEYAFLAFFATTQQRERDYQGTFLTACLQGTTFQLTLLRKVVLGMKVTAQEQDTQHLIHKPRQSKHSVTTTCNCPFLKRKIFIY